MFNNPATAARSPFKIKTSLSDRQELVSGGAEGRRKGDSLSVDWVEERSEERSEGRVRFDQILDGFKGCD